MFKAVAIAAVALAAPAFAAEPAAAPSSFVVQNGGMPVVKADPVPPARPAPATKEGPITVVAAKDEPRWKSEKLICHKQEVIGSLIATKRVCATARNWERQEASAKENLGVLIEPGAYSPNH